MATRSGQQQEDDDRAGRKDEPAGLPEDQNAGILESGTGDVRVDLADLERIAGVPEGERTASRGRPSDKDRGDREDNRGSDDEDREALRNRRRDARAGRKNRTREAIEEKDSAIADLQRQVADLSNGMQTVFRGGMEKTADEIERGMETAASQYREAKALHTRAVAEQKGDVASDAMEAMISAQRSFDQLENRKSQMIEGARRQREPQGAPPNVRKYGSEFIRSNSWYDPAGGDRDSARVKALDKRLASEGWDPNTKGYWDELQARVEDEMPHLFDDDDKDGKDKDRGGRGESKSRERGSPTGGSSRDGGGRGGSEYTIPADYVKNLKEAGMWDDPKQRAKMILSYRKTQDQLKREGKVS